MEQIDANKIAAEVITDLAKSTAKSLIKVFSAKVKDIKNKDEIEIGLAFEDYLNYSIDIYSKIKTLLYRHTPKNIYSFYECIGVRESNNNIIDTSNINNVLQAGNMLIISGSGGVGKSVMMKHFFLNTVNFTNYIPIIVELRGLNNFDKDTINLVDYIHNIMTKLKFNLDKEYFEYSLELGCYVILFDGFDEVKNEISNIVSSEIFSLCEKYPNDYYIVSSRPLQEFIGWNQFKELKTLPLSKQQALSLINKLEYDERIKSDFMKELDASLYEKYETFASNPLLLTIMLMTFENRMSIPDKLNDFFEQAFTTLFHTHDATKNGFRRDILSGLGYEDFKIVFSHFCFKSFFNSDYKFTEDKILDYLTDTKEKRIISQDFDVSKYLKDLTNSVCVIVHEGLDYSFSHRAFQEYFAALYTTQLDDKKQSDFIKMWFSEDNFRFTSNYLDMLYELQPSRFINNIINPALRELKKKYERNNHSKIWLIQNLIGEVHIGTVDGKKRCYVRVDNSYYYEMIKRSCKIYSYIYPDIDDRKDIEFIEFLEKHYDIKTISVSTLIKDGFSNELLEGLHWIISRCEFALDSLKNESVTRQAKTLASMLNEL